MLQEKKRFFTAKKVATMAVFTALSLTVSLFDFPLFPTALFLELDFGNVFILLIAFLFGPVEGGMVCITKELLHIPFGSTGGVGELANILITLSYILVPSLVYRFKKGLKVVVPSLLVGVICMCIAALFVNRYINFPLYMGEKAQTMFDSLWYIIVAFNLIKGVAISVITCLLYKTLSKLYTKFN